jgi:outer membrane protein assembly factor BamB
VYGDLMIVPCDGTDQQYVIALNKNTGEQVWKTKRPKMSGFLQDYHKSYCTPLVTKFQDADQVIVPGAQWVCAYEPLTGREIWRVRHGEGFSNAPCPVVAGDLVCICTGFMKPEVIAIKMDGTGDVTKTHVAWRISKQAPTMPSPVVIGHEIYLINDQGVATCSNISDGQPLWTKRIAGKYSSSPLFANGKIYFSSHEGKTTVIEPGSEYKEVAVNSLDGQVMASPAVFGETLILRTGTHLYRIGYKPMTATAP